MLDLAAHDCAPCSGSGLFGFREVDLTSQVGNIGLSCEGSHAECVHGAMLRLMEGHQVCLSYQT